MKAALFRTSVEHWAPDIRSSITESDIEAMIQEAPGESYRDDGEPEPNWLMIGVLIGVGVLVFIVFGVPCCIACCGCCDCCKG